jgi:hypothetical protein
MKLPDTSTRENVIPAPGEKFELRAMSGLRGTGPSIAGVRYPEFAAVLTGAAAGFTGVAACGLSGAAAEQLLSEAAIKRNPRRENPPDS